MEVKDGKERRCVATQGAELGADESEVVFEGWAGQILGLR